MAFIEMDFASGGSSGDKTYCQIETTLTQEEVECGFRPKKIICYSYSLSNQYDTTAIVYDEDISTTSQFFYWGKSRYVEAISSSTTSTLIKEITDNGFKINRYSEWYKVNIFAIG